LVVLKYLKYLKRLLLLRIVAASSGGSVKDGLCGETRTSGSDIVETHIANINV